jgi:hypothetical protein
MTVSELFQKALDIEAKYTPNSSLNMHISTSTSGKGIAKYKLQHDATGRSVDTGYGITNIKELLTVFDMGMAARYRFINEVNVDDLTIDNT